MTNQYALGYKAGLEAAVNACRRVAVCWPNNFSEARYAKHAAYECAEFIAALPVPASSQSCAEVQWRDDEALDALQDMVRTLTDGPDDSDVARVFNKARAVIAKWKDKNGTN